MMLESNWAPDDLGYGIESSVVADEAAAAEDFGIAEETTAGAA